MAGLWHVTDLPSATAMSVLGGRTEAMQTGYDFAF